jgi:hypothetical protein
VGSKGKDKKIFFLNMTSTRNYLLNLIDSSGPCFVGLGIINVEISLSLNLGTEDQKSNISHSWSYKEVISRDFFVGTGGET